ncbi:MAG: metal ABC transporter permease [Planctomycetota bacterium]
MSGLSLIEKVTWGAALLGGVAGVVGGLAVLRRRSLVGDMLAHASLPGVCLAFMATGLRSMWGLSLGALASGLAAVGLMTLAVRWTRTKEDAAIGIMLSTFFGLGVALLSRVQRSPLGGGSSGLDAYIFGEAGNMLTSDLAVIAVVGAAALGLTVLLYKEFLVVAFDSDFARSQGWPAVVIDLTMMGLVAVVTIVGLPIVGAVLIAALLIIPAATARLWTHRLHAVLMTSGVFGAVAGGVGARFGDRLPTGPKVVLALAVLFVLSLVFAPRRGLIARLASMADLRARVARDHLLRSLFELTEPSLPQRRTITLDRLHDHRHWRPRLLSRWLARFQDDGLLSLSGGDVQLTPLGLRRAADATRAHRLWELYMMRHVGSASDHVDRSADDVEHLLPPALVVELEEQLADAGRLPSSVAEVPRSPHRIDEAEG